jgi:Flp pilus assembly protein TadG
MKIKRENLREAQGGTSLLEMAFMLPILLLLIMVAVDFGRAYFITIEVSNAALAGAQYGALNPADTAGMQTAASADAADVPLMTATATSGCMCADGTGTPQVPCNLASLPTCGSGTRLVNFVTVNTQATYTPFFSFPGIFPAGFTIKGKATFPTGT